MYKTVKNENEVLDRDFKYLLFDDQETFKNTNHTKELSHAKLHRKLFNSKNTILHYNPLLQLKY